MITSNDIKIEEYCQNCLIAPNQTKWVTSIECICKCHKPGGTYELEEVILTDTD